VPDTALQRHYDLVKYLYGAGSRKGAPPSPLQGVWTADGGSLPPWKGDYHNDLNTQMTYLAAHAAGLDDAVLSFIEFNWERLPVYRDFARDFYGVSGAVVPGVMSLDGNPLGGWGQYSLSPTNGAWVAQSFINHWRFTADDDFLRERAYPFCVAIGEALEGLLSVDESGYLVLPLSTSPEIHDNTMNAWLSPNSNYDQALLKYLFRQLEIMANRLDDGANESRWASLQSKLGGFDMDEDGSLTYARDEPVEESHRHFSHLMAIHPLGLIDMGRAEDRASINASLDRTLAFGTQAWVGYSFSWMASLLARADRPDEALQYLRDYERAFTSRNGFHLNGDQIDAGLSAFRYRPFTLEGNFLAMDAIHEMLLRGSDEPIEIFPSVPREWNDVEFDRLRAVGGLIVSARRAAGKTVSVAITSTKGGAFTIVDPFGDGDTSWSHSFERNDSLLTFHPEPGETLTGQ
jgi:alpha-L-fucosidase 2